MKILQISDFHNAVEKAKDILYEKVDRKTVLFLSGGATPKSLYTQLANEKIIHPAAVGLIDERYGKKFHEKSNELMIKETGFLHYLSSATIPFYPILNKNFSREKTAKAYDKTTRDLFFHFPKSVAIMGVGADGHTSSIIPNRKDFIDPMFAEGKKQLFVGELNDTKSDYKERIGMTFAGLSLIDYFIVLLFGKEKKKALQKMFDEGSLEEIPARFFTQQASNNTIIITDQEI
ncbi:MAG TPA: 6-phosphogluconolactonase [Patescibacteria group bacterium]|nr:6-phosphogluconolactonase [Patescibacteria group bacterium]